MVRPGNNDTELVKTVPAVFLIEIFARLKEQSED